MVVALRLPLKVANIILGFIFSVLFSDFRTREIIDAETYVCPLQVLWDFTSSLWMYLSSFMHIMSMLWSITEAVSSSNWPILFKVLTLNVAICIVLLHFSRFCCSLSSVADFSKSRARAPASPRRASFSFFFTRAKDVAVDNHLMAKVFILTFRNHPYRWAAVVPRSNYLILHVEPLDSYAQDLVRHGVEPSQGLSAHLYVYHAASHG